MAMQRGETECNIIIRLGIDRFHVFKTQTFRLKNDGEKPKNETIAFKNNRLK